MCGIIGYVGNKNASSILLNGLKNLEYRGYDSCGIAVLNKELQTRKNVGKVSEVAKKENFLGLMGRMGIAHTRWATHGGVTKENAHPHLSNNKKIAVVHNGIIENHEELKKFLKNKGFNFYSETDTEVIPNLIEYEFSRNQDFVQACKKALKRLKGSYAVLILSAYFDGVIASRHESPLVIGVGDNEFFAASDIPAFLEYTKKVVYLYDYDFVVLNKNIKIFNLKKNEEVKIKISSIDWSVSQAKKGDFEHFMLKEINEQVETLKKALHQDKRVLNKIVTNLKNAKNIFFVACGSSYHAALTASYLFSSIANKQVNVMVASEFPNFNHFINKNSVVLAISQSGETADVLESVKYAKQKGAKIISIVNVMGSSLVRDSDEFLLLNAGPEICVLSTKSYTSQVVLLTLLAYSLVNKYEEVLKKINYLWNVVYYLTSENMKTRIKELARRIKNKEHLFTIGRGLEYPTAMEAALKIKEVSYIHAEAFPGGELKHGTIALIEKNTPCIVFVSEKNKHLIISNATELKSRGAYIIGVASVNNPVFDFWIKVPETNSFNPITQIIPIQLLAYELALLRKCNPDMPRNLAKSVTVK